MLYTAEMQRVARTTDVAGVSAQVADGFRPDVSHKVVGGVAELIRKCWAQNPAERPSAAEALAALDAIAGGPAPAANRTADGNAGAVPKDTGSSSSFVRLLSRKFSARLKV
jgi:hypothetical protein